MKAAEKGFVEVVAALLSKGALIDLRNKVIHLYLCCLRAYQWAIVVDVDKYKCKEEY